MAHASAPLAVQVLEINLFRAFQGAATTKVIVMDAPQLFCMAMRGGIVMDAPQAFPPS